MITVEFYVADLNLRSFFDHKVDTDRCRGNLVYFGADGSELAPVLPQEVLQHNLSFFHLGWIVLAFLRKPDFFLFKAVEYVALRNGAQARVLDLTDCRLLRDVDVNDDALRSVLPFKAKVVVVAGIPERVEVSLKSLRIVDIASAGEYACPYGLRRNAAVPVDQHLLDERLLRKQVEGWNDESNWQKNQTKRAKQVESATADGPVRCLLANKNKKPLYYRYEIVEEFTII